MFSRKDLLKLVIPLIIEQALAVTVGMVDSMMVSNVGEAAVSGVSIVDSINILLIGLFGALATGGAVVSAQFLGHKEEKSACASGEQLIISSLALSVILTAVTIFFGNQVLELLFHGVDSEVMQNARIYLFYSAFSFPFIAIYNACAALFRTMGNSKISMIISFVMNVIHVIMNATLIFGIGLGVEGAAISTLISRTFAAVMLFILLKNQKYIIHIRRLKDFRVNFVIIKKILRIGIPNGLENSVFQIGKIIVQGIMAGLGISAITANTVASNFGGYGTLPGVAISLAMTSVVGRCMGAHDYEGVKYYTRKLMKYCYIFMAVTNVLIIFMLPILLKPYHLSVNTQTVAIPVVIYHCLLSSLIWPTSFVIPSALRATNDVKYTMWISMFSMWIFRIGFSYILGIALQVGLLGLWIAMTIDWLFRTICFCSRFRKERYKNMSMI